MNRQALSPIQAEQVKQLYGALPLALFATLVNAAILGMVLYGEVPTAGILIWLGLLSVMVVARYALMRGYRRQQPFPPSSSDWQTRFYLGVSASALIWGGSALIVFPVANPAYQLLLLLLIVGTCAGAVSTLSYQWQAISYFLSLTLLPIAIRFALEDDDLSLVIAVLTVFFLIMMLLTSRRIYLGYQDTLLSREQAQASETRFRNLLQATPDALVIVDGEGKIELINQRAVELFGYTEGELCGKPVEILVPQKLRDLHSEHRQNLVQDEPDRPIQATRNVFARHRDGKEFPADVTLSQITYSGGNHICAAVRDVSERWETEQTLRKAKMAAEAANQAKSSFLSAMSHELRTPLNAILGFSQLVRDEPNLTATQRDNVGEIYTSGEHLLKLINDVLDLSRIEAGRMQLSLEPVQVGELIGNCLSMTESLARQHGIAIHTDIGNCLNALVRADRTRLLQTLLNLISNAIKYNRELGSVTLSCEIKAEDKLRLNVSDTGLGISPEKQRELFVPFSRLGKEFSTIEGTGIGLSLSKQIIEIMGGELGFNSDLGRGTTFWLELPYLGEAAAPASGIPPSKTLPAANDSPLLLHIEDNPINRQLVQQLLLAHGAYRLLDAAEPTAGLQLAREAQPQLILLDIDMPDMSGLEVAARLKADTTTQAIPILAVTAERPGDIAALRDPKLFAGYVAKPVHRQWLLEAIAKALDQTAPRPNT